MEHGLKSANGGGVGKTKCTRNNQSLNITGMTLHLAPSLVHVGGVKAAKGCESLRKPHRQTCHRPSEKSLRKLKEQRNRCRMGEMLAAAVKVSGPRLFKANRQVERWSDDRGVRKTGSKGGERRRGVGRGIKESSGRQVEDLDLPGSVGISEPSFATHLQPLTRCH